MSFEIEGLQRLTFPSELYHWPIYVKLLAKTDEYTKDELNALLTGAASDSFYRLMESVVDGIIEFKTKDTDESIEQGVRARLMRGSSCDTSYMD